MTRWWILICAIAALPIAAPASLDEEEQERQPGLDPEAREPTLDFRRPIIEPRRPEVEGHTPNLDQRRPLVDERRPNIDPRRPAIDPGVRPAQKPGFAKRSNGTE